MITQEKLDLLKKFQDEVILEKEEVNNFARQCNKQNEEIILNMNQVVLEMEKMSKSHVKTIIEKNWTIKVLSIALLCCALSTAVFAVAFFSSAGVPITLIALSVSLVTLISISVIPWGLIKERLIDGYKGK